MSILLFSFICVARVRLKILLYFFSASCLRHRIEAGKVKDDGEKIASKEEKYTRFLLNSIAQNGTKMMNGARAKIPDVKCHKSSSTIDFIVLISISHINFFFHSVVIISSLLEL